jgi:membrane protein
MESIGYVLVSAVGLLTFAFPVVLGPLIFRAALFYAPWLAEVESHFNIGRFAVAATLLTTSLLILHMWLPAGRRQFRQVWPGIVATLALWLTCGFTYGRYLSDYSYTYVNYYGGLASVMIALAFLYLTALIFIYGGELNAAIARLREDK